MDTINAKLGNNSFIAKFENKNFSTNQYKIWMDDAINTGIMQTL